jgi:hypothetical protein
MKKYLDQLSLNLEDFKEEINTQLDATQIFQPPILRNLKRTINQRRSSQNLNDEDLLSETIEDEIKPLIKSDMPFYLHKTNNDIILFKRKDFIMDNSIGETSSSALTIAKRVIISEPTQFVAKILYNFGKELIANSVTYSSIQIFFSLCNRFLGTVIFHQLH